MNDKDLMGNEYSTEKLKTAMDDALNESVLGIFIGRRLDGSLTFASHTDSLSTRLGLVGFLKMMIESEVMSNNIGTEFGNKINHILDTNLNTYLKLDEILKIVKKED